MSWLKSNAPPNTHTPPPPPPTLQTIDLSEANEPDIFGAIKGPAGLLENVMVDGITGVPDYADVSKTANGRVSYPLWHIANHEPSGTSRGAHPENVVFLTCDAFGVLPPVAKLTTEQAMYQFISGCTCVSVVDYSNTFAWLPVCLSVCLSVWLSY